jgi:hypothetical protein
VFANFGWNILYTLVWPSWFMAYIFLLIFCLAILSISESEILKSVCRIVAFFLQNYQVCSIYFGVLLLIGAIMFIIIMTFCLVDPFINIQCTSFSLITVLTYRLFHLCSMAISALFWSLFA